MKKLKKKKSDKIVLNNKKQKKAKSPKKKKSKKSKIADSTFKIIPYKFFCENDITDLGDNKYSKTYMFEDVNYNLLGEDEKNQFLQKYAKILNTFENNFINVQISLINEKLDKDEYIKDLTKAKVDNGLDDIREKYNEVIIERINSSKNFNLIKTKHYLVTTITESSLEKAKNKFRNVEFEFMSAFKSLNGSNLEVVSNFQKTRILSDIYRDNPYWHKDKKRVDFDFEIMDEKHFIASDYVQIKSDYIESDGKILKSFIFRSLPSSVSDQFVQEIMGMQTELIYTMNIEPINSGEAQKIIENKLTGLLSNKLDKQQKAWAKNFNDEILTHKIDKNIKSTTEYSNDLIKYDQKLFRINIIITIISDEENIQHHEEALKNIASKNRFEISNARFYQQEAFNSGLPIGNCTIPIARYMNTNSIAGFVPFDIKTMVDLDGFCYGKDIRDNIVMLNRKTLDNYNGFIIGSSGKGKSLSAKDEMTHIAINTNDDILVIDPDREYKYWVEKVNGETIDISTSSRNIINIMDIYEDYDGGSGDGFIKAKSDFLLTVFEVLLGGQFGLEPEERSIIDRHIRLVYAKFANTKNRNDIPTLQDLYNSLNNADRDKEISKSIALGMELYVTGSLSMFNGITNVDSKNRIVNFDIKDLGDSMKTFGLIVILDFIWRRVYENRLKGKTTWIFIDEIHLLYKNKYSLENVESAYKRFRKYAGFITGMTQNITDIVSTKEGRVMLSNSEFVKILSQSKDERDIIVDLFGLNKMQEEYITDAEKGMGLIKFGGNIIPINNKFPENSDLFSLLSTNPYKN